MLERDRAVVARTLDDAPSDAVLFVAESAGGEPLGFIHLTTAHDYYTDSETAHIADVVVAPAASGQGVARALVAYAEEWGRARDFALLTLNVFTANRAAREVYRKLGFEEEWIRCIKRL
jgi:ribosomal protein S18 acetylase RimI-like enzyme